MKKKKTANKTWRSAVCSARGRKKKVIGLSVASGATRSAARIGRAGRGEAYVNRA